jgi:predicted dehydrogenase
MKDDKNMKKIKFGTVGYGGMGTYHVEGLIPAEEERMEVVGTYDIDEERQEVAQENGTNVYSNFDELLADETVEAVLVATPNDSHKDLAIQALQAGKHVVCEKPVTMNLQEFDEILQVAEEENRVFMVHQNRRWDPDFLLVRELYEDRAIGDVFQIESRVHGANGIPGDWRHMKEHGGGMLLDWGIHLLDQILWMVDSPVADVKADMSYILGDEVDDGFTTYITFENGIRALVEVGTTNFTALPRWYVKGNKGTALIDDWDLNGEMVVATGTEVEAKPSPIRAGVGLTKTMAPPVEGVTKKIALPKPDVDKPSFYRNFYEVVRHDAEPIVKNEEVRTVMKLIDAIFEGLSE